MSRWNAENRLTAAAFRKVLDAHLFVAMDVDKEGRSVLGCSCGKRLNCDRVFHPETKYRDHLADEMEKFAQQAIRAGGEGG